MSNFHYFSVLLTVGLTLINVDGYTLEDLNDTIYFPDPNVKRGFISAQLKPSANLSWTPNLSTVHFYLVTSKDPDALEEIIIDNITSVESSNFIKDAPLKILSHGFSSSYTLRFPFEAAQEYVKRGGDMNVIMIDWEYLATSPWYNIAAPSTIFVGQHTGKLIIFLVKEGMVKMDDIHLIGHSLGAHLVGNAGRYLNGTVGRVTALDPALPFFDVEPLKDYSVDSSNAKFVDVIHTAGGYLTDHAIAFKIPRGHADFYPNNGEYQPGCDDEVFGGCSHSRASDYFIESIKNVSAFPACSCEHWYMFLAAKCDCSKPVPMGDAANKTARGRYYLLTKGANGATEGKYGLGINGITNPVVQDTGAGNPTTVVHFYLSLLFSFIPILKSNLLK